MIYILLAIFISACCVFFLRALPFIAFSKKDLPLWLEKLGKTLPSAIMAVLIIYCLKDIPGEWIIIGIPKLIAILIVAITYLYKKNTFVSIFLGTASYMLLLQLF